MQVEAKAGAYWTVAAAGPEAEFPALPLLPLMATVPGACAAAGVEAVDGIPVAALPEAG